MSDDPVLTRVVADLLPKLTPWPERRISPELLERQDYLVVVFDNKVDWEAACARLGVGPVSEVDTATVRAGRERANIGVGRVLLGSALLKALDHD